MLDFAPGSAPLYVLYRVIFQITLLSISLQSKAANVKDAQVLAKKLCKPSTLETKAQKELFPAASYGGKRQTRPFDPSSECCASSSQKKKKAANAQGRVTNVQVMLLKDYIPNIPRGKFRNELKSQGRVQTLQFRRSMSPLEVKSQISRGFRQVDNLKSWTYLQTDSNHLQVASNQQFSGEDVINRKGFLYLSQTVCKHNHWCH